MERTGPQVQVAPTRCPYCHEGIPRGEQPAVCPGCHALHHVACLDEAGSCAACGRKASSPEDSKLAAALRARASARVAGATTGEVVHQDRPPSRSPAIALAEAFSVGAALGGLGALGAGLPPIHGLLLAGLCGCLGIVTLCVAVGTRR